MILIPHSTVRFHGNSAKTILWPCAGATLVEQPSLAAKIAGGLRAKTVMLPSV